MMISVDWRQPFIDYLSEQKVPSDKNLAEQLIRRAKSGVLVGDKLYRRGASFGVLMKCVPRQEGKDILEEIHKGVCGNHASSRTLVSKAFRRAFYWPTALGDAEELVRRCQGCQYFAKQQHCRCLNLSTSMGGTRSKVEGGDRHDLEPEGTCEDTGHKIYTGSGSWSSYPTSCLE
jgi:hypothetical protein